jgi:hypothetical protein
MMVSAQVFQISPCAAPIAALLPVRAAFLAVDLAKRLCAPPVVQSLDPLLELADGRYCILVRAIYTEAIAEFLHLRIDIDRKNVCNGISSICRTRASACIWT